MKYKKKKSIFLGVGVLTIGGAAGVHAVGELLLQEQLLLVLLLKQEFQLVLVLLQHLLFVALKLLSLKQTVQERLLIGVTLKLLSLKQTWQERLLIRVTLKLLRLTQTAYSLSQQGAWASLGHPNP